MINVAVIPTSVSLRRMSDYEIGGVPKKKINNESKYTRAMINEWTSDDGITKFIVPSPHGRRDGMQIGESDIWPCHVFF